MLNSIFEVQISTLKDLTARTTGHWFVMTKVVMYASHLTVT